MQWRGDYCSRDWAWQSFLLMTLKRQPLAQKRMQKHPRDCNGLFILQCGCQVVTGWYEHSKRKEKRDTYPDRDEDVT